MNQIAFNYIKGIEKCKLVAYRDSKGVWTIGYGETGPDIVEGLTWTQEQADAGFLKRYMSFEDSVLRMVAPYHLSELQIAALISFEYNVGAGALWSSDILKFVRIHDYIKAVKAFMGYDHAGGVELLGLLKRRCQEAAMFAEGSV